MFLISFFKSLLSRHRLFQLLLLFAVLVVPALSTQAATFTVTKTADTFDGVCNADCSLRDAINAANSNGSGADTINFSVSGTISPTSGLPAILTSLTIDGGTINTYPEIELNGTSAGANSDGLVVQTPNAGGPITVTIKNMVVNRFGRYGIFVNCYDGCNFTLLRTMLGTNNVGTVDLGNGQSGIRILAYENSTFTIGGTGGVSQNVISGNNGDGISIVTAPNITNANTQIAILNNHVGVTDVGNDALGNSGNGISLSGASTGYKVTVGGTSSSSRNTVSGNQQNGIYASSNQLLVYTNSIGINPAGGFDLGNTLDGIRLDGNVNATIGGTLTMNGSSSSLENFISGNNGDGINIVSHNVTASIKRNYIGVLSNVKGATANSGNGIEIKDSSSVATADILIGSDTDALDGNVISGNGGQGILIDDKVGGIRIFGNKIGVNDQVSGAIPNLGGVRLSSAQNKIGKAGTAIAANFICGNTQNGILVIGANATGNEIYGNFIGTNTGGANLQLGNTLAGILINNASSNKIGNGLASDANAIAYNGADGVSVVSGTNNSIRGNAIYGNGALGINLGASGSTPNDAGDGDSGANDLQNFPVLTRAHPAQVVGSLSSTPNSHFVVDYYRVDTCNVNVSGGRYFLGSDNQVTTDQNGNATLNFPIPLALGQFVTATATQAGAGQASTSEFSQCIAVTPTQSLSFFQSKYDVNESAATVSVNIVRGGGTSGPLTVNYATQDGTAQAGQDYIAQSGTLSLADGEPGKVIDIPIINDALFENSETFKVVLSNLPPGVIVNSPTVTVTIQDNDDAPAFSISDFQAQEGNSGTKDFTFNVTLSAASGIDATVNFQTSDDQAEAGIDYQPISGTLTFLAGQTQKTIAVKVIGETLSEGDESFKVNLSNATNAGIDRGQATGTILNDDDDSGVTLHFSQATYDVQEDLTAVTITVIRSGDTEGTSVVNYVTSDQTATQRGDYEFASGTLTFAPGETSKTFQVLINEDSLIEGVETVNLKLYSPDNNEDPLDFAELNIMDDQPESLANPIDDAQSFVEMQYHDFLNREPDPAGLAFWTNEIASCGSDQQCIAAKRANVSAAFYLSIEFQETGYLIERLNVVAYGNANGTSTLGGAHQLPVPAVRLNEFLSDTQEIGQGVIVNQGNWQQQLENNKQAFIAEFAQRSRFTNAFPISLTPAQFVDTLNSNAGNPLSQSERDQLVSDLAVGAQTRTQVLRTIAEHHNLVTSEFNRAFVLMQYFGYLRRNPNDASDTDYTGYDFWLTKLNQFNGNFQNAEMVKAFITSGEYRQRFGP